MANGLFAFLAKGKTFPDGFLEKAVAAFPGMIATSAAAEGVLATESGNEPTTAEQIATLLYGDDLKDQDRYVFFGAGEAFEEEHMQPFPVVKTKDEDGTESVEIACYIVSPEWDRARIRSVFDKMMMPTVNRIVRLTEGNLDKVWEELSDSDLINEWTSLGGKSQIVLLASNGESLRYENVDVHETDFGFISDKTLLIAEEPKKEEPKTASKTGGFFSKKTPAASVPTVPPKETKDEKPKETTVAKDFKELGEKLNGNGGKPQNLDRVTLTNDEMYYQPPAGLKDEKQIKELYGKNAGFVPREWEKLIKVKLTDKAIKQKLKAKEAALKAKTATAVGMVQKSTDNKTAQAADDAAIKAGILNASQKEAIQSFLKIDAVKSDLDKSSKEMPTPEEMKAMEDEEVSFALQTGLPGLEATFRWSPKTLRLLCEKVPEAATILLRDYRHKMIKLERENLQLLEKLTAVETPADEKKTAPTKTEPTKQQATKTASKVSGFFGKKVANG